MRHRFLGIAYVVYPAPEKVSKNIIYKKKKETHDKRKYQKYMEKMWVITLWEWINGLRRNEKGGVDDQNVEKDIDRWSHFFAIFFSCFFLLFCASLTLFPFILLFGKCPLSKCLFRLSFLVFFSFSFFVCALDNGTAFFCSCYFGAAWQLWSHIYKRAHTHSHTYISERMSRQSREKDCATYWNKFNVALWVTTCTKLKRD